jgi:hypothetical protein
MATRRVLVKNDLGQRPTMTEIESSLTGGPG